MVYGAGVVQGIALVTFPALSTVFTDPSEYDLSSTEYGALFLPQVVTAISAALLGGALSGRFGLKRVYLTGLAADLVSMAPLSGARSSRATPSSRTPCCSSRRRASGSASGSRFRR